MLEVFTAPEIIPNSKDSAGKKKIFLAGSIDQDRAQNWQKQIISRLKNCDYILFNPRRNNWNSSLSQSSSEPTFREQVIWELAALDLANVIFLNLTAESIAPISLLELGLFAASGKVFICCPYTYWQSAAVQSVADYFKIPLYQDLEQAIAQLQCFTAPSPQNLSSTSSKSSKSLEIGGPEILTSDKIAFPEKLFRRIDKNSLLDVQSKSPKDLFNSNRISSLLSSESTLLHFSNELRCCLGLLELGLLAGSGKLIVSCEQDYWRRGNVEIVCEHFEIPLLNTLQRAIDSIS